MIKTTYDIVIDSISEVHGSYPGSVDVSFHREGGTLGLGERDGFESRRIALDSAIINDDGSVNSEEVTRQVVAAIGETEEVEMEGADE